MEGDVDGSAGILSVSVIRSSSSTFSCAVVSLSDAAACGSVRRRRSAVAVLVLVLSPVCDGGAERMEQAVVFEGPSAGCRERGRSAWEEDLGGGEGGRGRERKKSRQSGSRKRYAGGAARRQKRAKYRKTLTHILVGVLHNPETKYLDEV